MTLTVGSLFAGYDGLGMAVENVFGAKPAWFVEFDKAPSRVLAHHFTAPNLGDITAIDWATVEPVDILTGGFPCQDLSHAGKRAGLKPGTRSGLWEHMTYAIATLRPKVVVIENVRGLLSAKTAESEEVVRTGPRGGRKVDVTRRAISRVVWDLADLGYVGSYVSVRASDVGAPHLRFRVFIVAVPAWSDPLCHTCQDAGDCPDCAPLPLLPTPTAGDGKSSGSRNLAGSKAHAGVSLTDAIVHGDSTTGRSEYKVCDTTSWGKYEPAIRHWEKVLGRPAPMPTEIGAGVKAVLSPLFVEWMMGLPEGWVTDPAIGLTRAQQLKMLGNGVCPQQAEVAIRAALTGMAVPSRASTTVLPTPEAKLATSGPDYARASRPRAGANDLTTEIALLPTPAVNDMGEGKTVEAWDAWTERMKAAHRNGNGHGNSLSIEAQRIVS